MSRSRVSRVYKAGRGAFVGTPTSGQDNLLRAMAAMVAEATQIIKPTAKVKKEAQDKPKLPFGPGELYDACLQRVPHIIACVPYNKTWFGRLGKALQNTDGLREDDLETFVSWVENDGLDWFHNCTFAHVIKHWDGWIVKARAGVMSGNTGVSAEDYL
jgi:hypothetical protein